MRLAETALGALLIAGACALLPLGIRASSGARELRVSAPTPAPHAIASRREEPIARLTAGPPSLLRRLEQGGAQESERAGPGLSFLTWQVTYGRRWERQVTFPVLDGPFDSEGTPWPCAALVKLAPSFFDDGKPGGADVESVMDRMVRAQFPFDAFSIHFASVAATALKVRPIAGALEVSGTVTLADGSVDPTRFILKGQITLGEREGDLAPKLSDLQVTWTGRTRRDPLVTFAGLFMNVDAQARGEVLRRMDAALSVLKLPREPIAPFDDRPADRLSIRLCSAPLIQPDGMTVSLRAVVKLAEPRVDSRVVGPAHLAEPPRREALSAAMPEGATLEGVASPAAVQQALYLLWQAGQLTRWGSRPDVVGAFRDKLADRLALDFKALSVRLPPSVLGADPDGSLGVRFADLVLGRLDDGREVVAHGDVKTVARIEAGRIGLRGTLGDLRVSCVSGPAMGLTLSPCFSDVVPVIRESGMTSEGLPLEMPIPDKLLRLNLVLGTELVLRDLRAEMKGGELRMRARAELVDKAASSAPSAPSAPGPKAKSPR